MLFMVSGCPSEAGLELCEEDRPRRIGCAAPLLRHRQPRRLHADGKFVFDTLDGFVIALDGQTGQEVWVVKHAFPEKGETITSAPLIADDKVLISFAGSEFAARDNKWTLSMFARKVETGEAVWV